MELYRYIGIVIPNEKYMYIKNCCNEVVYPVKNISVIVWTIIIPAVSDFRVVLGRDNFFSRPFGVSKSLQPNKTAQNVD